MKKLLGLVLVVLLLATCSCGMSEAKHNELHKTQALEYQLWCDTDTVVVGYQYLFTYNDSADMNYSVFNPEHKELLAKYENLTYADTSDLVSARGYYFVVRGLDKKVANTPKASQEIRITRDMDWLGYVKWREGK